MMSCPTELEQNLTQYKTEDKAVVITATLGRQRKLYFKQDIACSKGR